MWFPECPLFGGKNTLQKRFGTKDSVRCSEFRGGRFSEVANVLQVWDFQSVTRTLSALGSVSAQGGSTVMEEKEITDYGLMNGRYFVHSDAMIMKM